MSNITKLSSLGYIAIICTQAMACDTDQRYELPNSCSGFYSAKQQKSTPMRNEIDLSSYEKSIPEFFIDLRSQCHSGAIEIDISNNSLGNEVLKELSVYPNFQRLYLNDNRFTDEGAQYLANFKKAREVNLSDTFITSKGIGYLPLENLEVLQVNFLKLQFGGLEILSAAPKINHLNICGAALDDTAVPLFITMKNRLKLLDISYNNFSPRAIATLKEGLPTTTIVANFMHQ